MTPSVLGSLRRLGVGRGEDEVASSGGVYMPGTVTSRPGICHYVLFVICLDYFLSGKLEGIMAQLHLYYVSQSSRSSFQQISLSLRNSRDKIVVRLYILCSRYQGL